MEDDSNEEVAPVGRLDSFILSSNTPSTQYETIKPSLFEQRITLLEKKLEEQSNTINELKSENIALKNQLNDAFQNIITIYNKLDNYNKIENFNTKLNQINLNFLYYSMDDKLYKLEESYKSLNHDIIKTRGEYGLINSGIKHYLKSNIAKCELKYKSSVDGKNKDIYHNKCDDILYQLFIIKTTNNKRFGIFFCNNKKNMTSNSNNTTNINNNNINNNLYSINSLSNSNIFTNRNYNYNENKELNYYQTLRSFNSFNDRFNYNYNNYFSNQDNLSSNNNNNNNLLFSSLSSLSSLSSYRKHNTVSVDFNNNYDTNKKNEIFNCKSKPDKFFAFSLNNFKNYYLNNKNGNYTPCFSIYFDPNRESFYGKEKKNSSGQYLLTGKEEFNILEFEVYEIDV